MTRVAALVAVMCAALAACSHPPPPAPAVRPVQLAEARAATGLAAAAFAGEVKPRHESDLGFRIPGKVIARYVDAGSRVTRGQVLARLDPADVGLQADAQRAAVTAAQNEVTFAQAEYERYESLYRQKFVSASALDQKRNALDTNRAKLAQSRAQLAVTQNQASYAALTAPEAGVVTSVQAEAGQVVAAGQSVMKIAREDEREVAIAVPESRLGELKAAAALGVVLWADRTRVYPARVREIAPSVDPVTRTFAVRVAVLQPDAALQWGMTANVVLQGADIDGVIVPLTSIHREGDRPAVWIYDPQTQQVALRPVTIAQYREDGAIVGSGVSPGERVVAAGVHKLLPGQKVRPYDGPGAEAAPGAPTTPAPAPKLAAERP
jgi:multidrug efflux system membrane fusion protein